MPPYGADPAFDWFQTRGLSFGLNFMRIYLDYSLSGISKTLRNYGGAIATLCPLVSTTDLGVVGLSCG